MLKGFTHRLGTDPGRILSLLFLLAALSHSLLLAQQPQASSGTPLFDANAKYVQGVGPGYWPTAGTGLTLNLSSGTAVCSNAVHTYTGGTLTMAAGASNYVFLNAASNCVPNSNTAGFDDNSIPIAQVTTNASSITNIADLRTWFLWRPSGTGGTPAPSVIADATQFPGADAGAKAQACLSSLPVGGGTCDARGLTGAQAFSSTVAVPANTTLLLGAGTYTCGQLPCITLASGSRVVGMGGLGSSSLGVTVIQADLNGPGAMIQSANPSSAIEGVLISELFISNTSPSTHSGVIGVDLQGINHANIERVRTHYVNTGFRLGANSTGSYYNLLSNVQAIGVNIGMDFGINAYANETMGGSIQPWTTGGICFSLNGGRSNGFYSPDCENATSGIGFDIYTEGNGVYNPYVEAVSTGFKLNPGSNPTTIIGGGGLSSVATAFDFTTLTAAQKSQMNINLRTVSGSIFYPTASKAAEYSWCMSAGSACYATATWTGASTGIQFAIDGASYSPVIVNKLRLSDASGNWTWLQTGSGNGTVTVPSTTDTVVMQNLGQTLSAKKFSTLGTGSNCISASGSCGSAAAGMFTIAAGLTSTTITTTAVTSGSEVFLSLSQDVGNQLGVTCNTDIVPLAVTGRTAGTSFTASVSSAPSGNPLCLTYFIVN